MKKNYGFARLMKVLKPSPARVEERCAVARQCGGCQLQMMSYEEQLKFKQRKVYNNLKRIGGLDNLYLPGEGLGAGENLGMEKEIEREIEKEERADESLSSWSR